MKSSQQNCLMQRTVPLIFRPGTCVDVAKTDWSIQCGVVEFILIRVHVGRPMLGRGWIPRMTRIQSQRPHATMKANTGASPRRPGRQTAAVTPPAQTISNVQKNLKSLPTTTPATVAATTTAVPPSARSDDGPTRRLPTIYFECSSNLRAPQGCF